MQVSGAQNDKSDNYMMPGEDSNLKDQTHNHLQHELKNQVVYYGSLKLIPYYLGGHQGYYSDLAPVPKYTPIEYIFEVLCFVTLVLTWVFFQLEYDDFPERIPIIFSASGNILEQGEKLILYLFPGLDTFCYVILTILQLITNRFRYKRISVTPENSRDIFQTTRKLILYCKFYSLLIFVYITFGYISLIKDRVKGYLMTYGLFLSFGYGFLYYNYEINMQKVAQQ